MTISRAARLLLPSTLLIGLGLLAPGLVGAASVTIVSTGAQSFTFSPGTVAIDAGSSVTWTNCSNAGSEPHTVTSDSGAFSSEILEIGQTYTHTFNRAGRFAYHCEVHPEMTGVVVVTGGQATPPPTPKPTPAPTLRPTPPPTPKPTVAPTKTPSPTGTAPARTPQPTRTTTPTPARTAAPTARPTSRPTATATAVTPTPSATVAASPQGTATPAPTANPTASDVIAASPSAASAAPVTPAGSSAAGSVPVTTPTLAAIASAAPSPPGTASAAGDLSGAQPAASGESPGVLIVGALALLAALGVGAVLLRGRRSG